MTELISTLGFPAAMCIAVGWYTKDFVNQTIQQLREDNKEDKDILLEEIKYNREVNQKLLNTNELLVKELTVKVDSIGNKLDNFTHQIGLEEDFT